MLLMVFLACFQMGFLPCDHGLDFEIGLCENSINQSIMGPFDLSRNSFFVKPHKRTIVRPGSKEGSAYVGFPPSVGNVWAGLLLLKRVQLPIGDCQLTFAQELSCIPVTFGVD